MYKFETTLIDGNVYSMSYFEVADNTGLFKPTKHPYKVNFQFNTEVRPMNQNPISVDPYSFVPLADVMSTAYDTSFLIGKSNTINFPKILGHIGLNNLY